MFNELTFGRVVEIVRSKKDSGCVGCSLEKWPSIESCRMLGQMGYDVYSIVDSYSHKETVMVRWSNN